VLTVLGAAAQAADMPAYPPPEAPIVVSASDTFGAMTFKNVYTQEIRVGIRWSFDPAVSIVVVGARPRLSRFCSRPQHSAGQGPLILKIPGCAAPTRPSSRRPCAEVASISAARSAIPA
jgi:hypothetical protein